MKKKTFQIISIIAFLIPVIDLLYYMITAFCFGNKYARVSVVFMALYYVPFGIAELIAHSSVNSLLFGEKWTSPKKVRSVIALIVSIIFMIAYFIYLHVTFMYRR